MDQLQLTQLNSKKKYLSNKIEILTLTILACKNDVQKEKLFKERLFYKSELDAVIGIIEFMSLSNNQKASLS